MDTELASIGTRRRAGNLRSAQPNPAGTDDHDEFHAALPLPPVSRAKQAAVLAAAFFAIFLTIGYNQSYGVFQEYYLSETQDLLPGIAADPPTALLTFVGTLGAGLTWAGSILVNPLLSRIDHAAYLRDAPGTVGTATPFLTSRALTLAGVALMGAGFLLASWATRVWHLLLTQGLLYGLGSSLLYFPLLGPAPEYFERHRGTALGLMLSGGGLGSLVLSPALRALLSALGGRWTLRLMAAAYVVLGVPVAWAVPRSRFVVDPSASTSTPTQTLRRRTHVSAALVATPAFLLSTAAAFCQSAGAQLPLSFIPSYSVALGLSSGRGANLLAVSNVVNALARVATGYAGDRLGRLNVLVASLAGAAATVGGLWGTSVEAGGGDDAAAEATGTRLWLAFIVLYSVTAGGYYALFPATIADVFGIRSYAAVNGFIYFVRGCGTMLGSPVGGVLIHEHGGSSSSRAYGDVVVWDGALLVGSALCVGGIRWADALRRGWVWRA